MLLILLAGAFSHFPGIDLLLCQVRAILAELMRLTVLLERQYVVMVRMLPHKLGHVILDLDGSDFWFFSI